MKDKRAENGQTKLNRIDFIFAFLTVAFIFYCFKYGGLNHPLDGDFADQIYGIVADIGRAIRNGELPLWNPFLWGGYPMGSRGITFNPLFLFFGSIFYDSNTNMVSFDVMIYIQIFTLCIYTISVYILLRVLQFNQLTCIISTLCFALIPTHSVFLEWLFFYSAISYLPLLIALLVLMVKEENSWKYVSLAGIVLGIIGLSSAAQPFLMTFLIISIYGVFYIWHYRKDRRKSFNIFSKFVVVFVVGISICSVSLVPFIEFMWNAFRFVPGSEDGVITLPLFTENKVSIDSINSIFGNSSRWMNYGPVFIVLLVCSFFIKRISNKPVFYASQFIFVCSLLYSVGVILPQIFYYIPFYNAIREPFLYVPIVTITGTLLAAYSLNAILNYEKINETFYKVGILSLIIVITSILFVLPHNFLIQNFIIILTLYIIFILWFVYGNLQIKKYKNLIRNSVVLLLAVITMISSWNFYGTFSLGSTSLDKKQRVIRNIESTQNLLNELQFNKDNMFRIVNWGEKAYSSNISSIIGFYDSISYLNPVYQKTWDIHQKVSISKRSQLQNIKYLVHGNSDPEFEKYILSMGFNQTKIISGVYPSYSANEPIDVFVYESPNTTGNAWFVSNFMTYDSATEKEKIWSVLNDPHFDLTKTALINTDFVSTSLPKLDEGNSSIQLLKYKHNTVEYQLETDTTQLLITSDFYYPGWNVYIDGKKTDIMEVNYAFRGVIVEPGIHKVTFRFLPKGFVIGSVISILGIIIALSILLNKIFSSLRNVIRI